MPPASPPDFPRETLDRWQRVVDLTARMAEVPAALVMRTDGSRHSVLLGSDGPDNPYATGQSFVLSEKLYCHAVLSGDAALIVEDARGDPLWHDNDDLEFGMSFYMGYPLHWPDGTVLGTLCVLDRRRNGRALECRELLAEFRDLIESDLALHAEIARRRRAESELRALLETLETRVARRTEELGRANTTLQVLVERMADTRERFESDVLRQLRTLVLPHLESLKGTNLPDADRRLYLELLEKNLADVTGRFAARMTTAYASLTRKECEIAELVLHGRSTKDIARTLSRETSTIDFHRRNIRRKLGLGQRRISLRSYLMSLRR